MTDTCEGLVRMIVGGAPGLVRLARGESVIKCPSSLNVLKYTYDHSCYLVRSDEHQ
jgi:hypothetical protein